MPVLLLRYTISSMKPLLNTSFFIIHKSPLVLFLCGFYWHGQSGDCSTASSRLICHPNSWTCLEATHADNDFLSDSCCTFVDAEALFYIPILISISSIIFRLRKLSTLSDVHDMNVMFDHGGTLPFYSQCCTLGVLPTHFTKLHFSSQQYKRMLRHDWKTNKPDNL